MPFDHRRPPWRYRSALILLGAAVGVLGLWAGILAVEVARIVFW